MGVTLVSYSASTGKIDGAHIYLNQTTLGEDRFFEFSSDSSVVTNGRYFLGDVVTHELGHFMGLSHSEVLDSSMVYTAFRGQSTLAGDDISALRGIYSPASFGKIHGYVKGGQSIPIFGAHVQIVSVTTGEVVGAAFTQDNGSFSIAGLSKGDYLIFVSPMKAIDKTQTKYFSVKNNFCPTTYKGEFFQGCSTDSQGKPQVISLNDKEVKDIGVMSIHCQGRYNSSYVIEKFAHSSVTSTEIDSFNVWRGFFRPLDVTLESFDTNLFEEIIIDLTQETLDPFTSHYLKLNLVSEIFGSKMAIRMEVSGPNGNTTYSNALDTFNKLKNNISINYPLSSNSSLNMITVRLYPRKLTLAEQLLTFPSVAELTTTDMDFVIIPSITTSLGEVIKTPQSASVGDESLCLDGPFSYRVSAQKDASLMQSEKNSVSNPSDSENQNNSPLSCGTIDGGKGGGGGGFFVGLFLAIILARLFHFPWKNLLSRLV